MVLKSIENLMNKFSEESQTFKNNERRKKLIVIITC